MREHQHILYFLAFICASKLRRSENAIGKVMIKSNPSPPKFASTDINNALTNMLAAFIIKTPAKVGWWHRIPTQTKGTTFDVDKLFPHLGTLFGLPDYIMSELLCEIGAVRKRTTACTTNADMWSYFKANHQFTNSNVELACCKFENTSIWFMKIGLINKGPAALHAECKRFGKHEPPVIRGQCRQVIKLISRGLGNIINDALVEDTANEFQKDVHERNSAFTRPKNIEENNSEKVVTNPNEVLGMRSIYDGIVPNHDTNPCMNHIKK